MTARELYQAGRLNEAVQALSAEVRDNPTDAQRRTFLFELLCFAGDFDRARKHLELLAKENQKAGMGALLYEACMNSERTRLELFDKKEYPHAPAAEGLHGGELNGKRFTDIVDGDPRIGPRLEVFTAGAYLWIPFEHIISMEMQPPKRLRDLLWAPVIIQTGDGFKQRELGECLLPVLAVNSFKHADDQVRLGRQTVWEDTDGVATPYGQKVYLVDDEEVSVLEIRSIEFDHAAEEPSETQQATA